MRNDEINPEKASESAFSPEKGSEHKPGLAEIARDLLSHAAFSDASGSKLKKTESLGSEISATGAGQAKQEGKTDAVSAKGPSLGTVLNADLSGNSLGRVSNQESLHHLSEQEIRIAGLSAGASFGSSESRFGVSEPKPGSSSDSKLGSIDVRLNTPDAKLGSSDATLRSSDMSSEISAKPSIGSLTSIFSSVSIAREDRRGVVSDATMYSTHADSLHADSFHTYDSAPSQLANHVLSDSSFISQAKSLDISHSTSFIDSAHASDFVSKHLDSSSFVSDATTHSLVTNVPHADVPLLIPPSITGNTASTAPSGHIFVTDQDPRQIPGVKLPSTLPDLNAFTVHNPSTSFDLHQPAAFTHDLPFTPDVKSANLVHDLPGTGWAPHLSPDVAPLVPPANLIVPHPDTVHSLNIQPSADFSIHQPPISFPDLPGTHITDHIPQITSPFPVILPGQPGKSPVYEGYNQTPHSPSDIARGYSSVTVGPNLEPVKPQEQVGYKAPEQRLPEVNNSSWLGKLDSQSPKAEAPKPQTQAEKQSPQDNSKADAQQSAIREANQVKPANADSVRVNSEAAVPVSMQAISGRGYAGLSSVPVAELNAARFTTRSSSGEGPSNLDRNSLLASNTPGQLIQSMAPFAISKDLLPMSVRMTTASDAALFVNPGQRGADRLSSTITGQKDGATVSGAALSGSLAAALRAPVAGESAQKAVGSIEGTLAGLKNAASGNNVEATLGLKNASTGTNIDATLAGLKAAATGNNIDAAIAGAKAANAISKVADAALTGTIVGSKAIDLIPAANVAAAGKSAEMIGNLISAKAVDVAGKGTIGAGQMSADAMFTAKGVAGSSSDKQGIAAQNVFNARFSGDSSLKGADDAKHKFDMALEASLEKQNEADAGDSTTDSTPINPALMIVFFLSLAGFARTRMAKETDQSEDVVEDKPTDTTNSTALPLRRRSHMVLTTDTLQSIAEKYFSDARAAWLIADLNTDSSLEHKVEERRVVELSTRQMLALPEISEVKAFLLTLPVNFDIEKRLVTVVNDTMVDEEILRLCLGMFAGCATGSTANTGSLKLPELTVA